MPSVEKINSGYCLCFQVVPQLTLFLLSDSGLEITINTTQRTTHENVSLLADFEV